MTKVKMGLKLSLFTFLFSLYLSLSVFLNVEAQNQKCDGQKTFCNSNCSVILGCMGAGMDPISLKSCPAETPCKEEAGKASCTGKAGECATSQPAPSIKCGSLGEIPHPTECGSTVKCEKLKDPPAHKCDCSAGSFPDLSRVSLPCKAGSCSRKLVTCDKVGQSGNLQGNTDYCYICLQNEEILVYICDGSAKRKAVPGLFAANAKTCKPIEKPTPTTEEPTTTTEEPITTTTEAPTDDSEVGGEDGQI